MKILLVSDYAAPNGGAEIVGRILRDGLRGRGHDARLFSSSVGRGERGWSPDYWCLGTTSRLRGLLQTANPSAVLSLRTALADFRPDVVHVRMFLTQLSPLILPLLRDVPSLHHVVWYRPVCPLGTKLLPDGSVCNVRAGTPCLKNRCLPLHDWGPLMFQRWLHRRWRGAFWLLVANSETVKQRLVEDGFSSVLVVPNGVPVTAPRPPLQGPPAIVFAGRLVREKGAVILLRAFARVAAVQADARLILAGDGPERAGLEDLARGLGLSGRVHFAGKQTPDEIERHRDQAWVQAVPSLWDEPFGIVAVEAMMRGVAVVASARGGLREIVSDGETGRLVAPGDTVALAHALLEILGSREHAERMGAAARRLAASRFSDTLFVKRFEQIYGSLISGDHRRGLAKQRDEHTGSSPAPERADSAP